MTPGLVTSAQYDGLRGLGGEVRRGKLSRYGKESAQDLTRQHPGGVRRIQCAAHVPPRSGKVRTVTHKKAWILMYSLTRKAPRGMGERPKVSQNCFLRASCHFLSMPEHLYAVEERPGSVRMPSWGAPATPRECPGRSKERPGGSKIVLRSGPSHPRVTKNVVRMPPDRENHDFLKSMFYLGKT